MARRPAAGQEADGGRGASEAGYFRSRVAIEVRCWVGWRHAPTQGVEQNRRDAPGIRREAPDRRRRSSGSRRSRFCRDIRDWAVARGGLPKTEHLGRGQQQRPCICQPMRGPTSSLASSPLASRSTPASPPLASVVPVLLVHPDQQVVERRPHGDHAFFAASKLGPAGGCRTARAGGTSGPADASRRATMTPCCGPSPSASSVVRPGRSLRADRAAPARTSRALHLTLAEWGLQFTPALVPESGVVSADDVLQFLHRVGAPPDAEQLNGRSGQSSTMRCVIREECHVRLTRSGSQSPFGSPSLRALRPDGGHVGSGRGRPATSLWDGGRSHCRGVPLARTVIVMTNGVRDRGWRPNGPAHAGHSGPGVGTDQDRPPRRRTIHLQGSQPTAIREQRRRQLEDRLRAGHRWHDDGFCVRVEGWDRARRSERRSSVSRDPRTVRPSLTCRGIISATSLLPALLEAGEDLFVRSARPRPCHVRGRPLRASTVASAPHR